MYLFVHICYSLFPLLLRYDENISLSTVGYFYVVKVISSNQSELESSPVLVGTVCRENVLNM